MPASCIPAVAYVRMPENSGALVTPALVAEPAAAGALRLDVTSPSLLTGSSYARRTIQTCCQPVPDPQNDLYALRRTLESSVLEAEQIGGSLRAHMKTQVTLRDG